jgi:glutathione S-transferase
MGMILYDLAGRDPSRRFSPYCWRTRLALEHKQLPVETIPWRFTEKDIIAPSNQGHVPVVVDGDKWISGSWAIACYLEDTYPDRPSLFGGDHARALTRMFSCFADTLVPAIFQFIALDVYTNLHEKDLEYFRTSREERVGATLEELADRREARLPDFRESLNVLRATLKTQQFLAGDHPMYADYAIFGPFQWARCTSPFRLLADRDPLRAWIDRMLDAYDGLARNVPAYDS